eukprot:TRINITY_DN781819_c0_g1_i1.p1 TRINITY_DN781819_c0_g1~~TRINITY_DN781819_c0_g1_i1.p1  ORF type:complete len:311 (-),score=120.95 TRINITY_DN781819_c0_g1_i1:230-1162(-)
MLSRVQVGLRQFAQVQKAAVIGLGLMGHGVVQTIAESKIPVIACEINDAAIERGMSMIDSSLQQVVNRNVKKDKMTAEEGKAYIEEVKSFITTTTDKKDLKDCDIVIEAVIENMDLKKSIIKEVAGILKPEGIIATNTSSLKVTEIAEASGRPESVLGVHFFNPVQMMKLVELVQTDVTNSELFQDAQDFVSKLGKTPVPCKDTPGFIVNRLLIPYIGEAIGLLERGDASAKDIDVAMKLGAGVPMGPIQLADYVGLDTCLFILQGWVQDYPNDPSFRVPKLLEELVEAGKLGRKTGEGFFKWEGNKCLM